MNKQFDQIDIILAAAETSLDEYGRADAWEKTDAGIQAARLSGALSHLLDAVKLLRQEVETAQRQVNTLSQFV